MPFAYLIAVTVHTEVVASSAFVRYRGRDTDFSAPPAQIRASPIKALGSYLDRSMSRPIRSHVSRCRWLRRRRLRNHLSITWTRNADSMRVLVGTAK